MLVTAGEEALDEDTVFDAVSGCDESVFVVEADGITCCCDDFRRFSLRFKYETSIFKGRERKSVIESRR